MKFYTRFDRPVVSGLVCGDSMTHQSFKDECDINFIMQRAMRTGVLPPNERVARYGDFSDVPAYQESLDTVLNAQNMFNSLPAKVRARFGNDPSALLAFVADSANFDEAVKLGLCEPRKVPDAPKDDFKASPPSKEVPPKSSSEPPSK